jgi:uncharacterized DUF497 family protein
MEFEWDAIKARTNLRRHGVSFEKAKSVFKDPLTMTFPDREHSEMEERYITIGASTSREILLVVHTDQGESIRLISARGVTSKERRAYEERI